LLMPTADGFARASVSGAVATALGAADCAGTLGATEAQASDANALATRIHRPNRVIR
jgi:hypothetical protein